MDKLELSRRLTARMWTPELVRALDELRARHPEASFELAGIEVALSRAIENLAGELTRPEAVDSAA